MYKRLKESRKRLRLRQCDVAKQLNICTATYNRYEKGVLNLDAIRLGQIADIYGVSVDYLLMRTDIPSILSVEDSHIDSKKEYTDFLIKYTALDAQGKGAIHAILEYEYQQMKNSKKTNLNKPYKIFT